MEIFRRYFVLIILSAIIIIVWGGILLLSDKSFTSLNPNAEMYVKPLQPTFDQELLTAVSERTQESFPILPSVFFELNSD